MPFHEPGGRERAAPFPLHDEFRVLQPGDLRDGFRCGDGRVDRFPLRDWLAWADRPGEEVFVREYEGSLGALAHVAKRGPTLHLELLARHAGAPRGYAGPLLSLLDYVARQLACDEIHLEAMGERLAEHYEAYGYEPLGSPYDDPEWGTLVPMVKRVA